MKNPKKKEITNAKRKSIEMLKKFFLWLFFWDQPGTKIVKIKSFNCFLIDSPSGQRTTNSMVWNWPRIKCLLLRPYYVKQWKKEQQLLKKQKQKEFEFWQQYSKTLGYHKTFTPSKYSTATQ